MAASFVRRRPAIFAFIFAMSILLLVIWFTKKDIAYWKNFYSLKAKIYFNLRLSKDQKSKPRMKNPGLILDTPGCKIPKLDPFDPSVVELYEAKGPFKCPGPPSFLKSKPDGSITLNVTILKKYYRLTSKDVSCSYQAIRRKYEKPGNVRENDYDLLPSKPLQFDTPLDEDHVKVKCKIKSKYQYLQYFPLVNLKKDVEKMKTRLQQSTPQLNIILLGIDSISKLNFLRHLKKTHAFIKENNFFDMKGYTKVGDNTFPNLTPLLTGHHIEDIWNETLKNTMYWDKVDLVWSRLAQKGYRTFFAEDSPYFGLFNYGRRGFNETPTDYYIRPLYLAIHNSEVRKKGPWYCFNSQLETDLIYDYLRDMVQAMGPRPYFAFAMVSSLTHDYFNYAGYADYPTIKLLEDLWEYGANNNSVIVMFGDHGLRFGGIRKTYIGKFEERMPFMYIYFPPWFLEQNPNISKHLHTNQERLTTLFDIHATMIHLMDPTRELTPEEKNQLTPNGVSLMDEISPYRTCEKAAIFEHWCVCQVMEELPLDDIQVLKAAALTVDCINNALKQSEGHCVDLALDSVTNAKLGQINDIVLRFVKHENIIIDRNVVYGDRTVKYEDYVITIVTKPNRQIFESTVRRDVVEDVLCVVDIYEASPPLSDCVEVQKMETFKYCNN